MRPIFDNQSFIEWLGKHDPASRYIYDSSCNCLIARYLKDRFGFRSVWVSTSDVVINDESRIRLPFGWDGVAEGEGKTFGAALRRAEALLS